MSQPSPLAPPARRLRRAAAALALCAGLPALAQPPGPNGIAFWSQPVAGDWFEPLRWGGVLPWQAGVPNAGATAHLSWPVTVTLPGNGLGGECHHLSIGEATLRIVGASAHASLTVHGTQIDNAGSIVVGGADATSGSSLRIANHSNANGTGSLRLAGPANEAWDATLAPTFDLGWLLVNWPGHRIVGNGDIKVRLQNDGLIEADVPGRELRFSGTHRIDNNGLVAASGGGRLRLAMANGDSGFHQSGSGLLMVGDGSELVLQNAGTPGLVGGRLQTVGSGRALVISQGFPIQGVELVAGSTLTFFGNAGVFLGPATVTNDGLIHTGPQGFIASRFGQAATVAGSGRIRLEGGALSSLSGGGGYALVNGPDHTISGVGHIALQLTNLGTVDADRNGQGSGPGELLLQNNSFVNDGLVRARDGGTLRLFQGEIAQGPDGRIEILDGSAMALQGSATGSWIRGGTLRTTGSGLLYSESSNVGIEDLRIEAGSAVLAPCFRTLLLAGSIANDGLLAADSGGCGPAFGLLQAQGTAQILGAGEVRLLAHAPGANARLDAGAGSLALGADQWLTGEGRLSGALRVDGRIQPDQPYAPAHPVGRLSLDGGASLVLTASSRLHVDLDGLGSFDRIEGSGSVALDGALVIGASGGFVPVPGDQFDLVTGSAVGGGFRDVVFPPAYPPLDARIEVLTDRARLVVTPPVFVGGFE